MNSEERQQKINGLKPSQAISIVRTLADNMRGKMSSGYSLEDIDKVQALAALYKEAGYEIDKNYVEEHLSGARENRAAQTQAAKEFLKFIATKDDDSGLLMKLDKKLEEPPSEEIAFLGGLEFMPIIIAGSIALLNVTSGIKYENGKVVYNPSGAIEVIKANIDGVVSIFKSIIPPKKG